MNYKLILLAGFIVILAIGFGAAYLMLRPTTTPTTTTTSVVTKPTTTITQSQNFYLLVFTQKGISMVLNPFSPSSSFLGFQHVVNISLNTPDQVYFWEQLPYNSMIKLGDVVFMPLNNGTVYAVNTSTMKVIKSFQVGNSIGFIGIDYSPNMQYVAIADGPSGVVEVINVQTLQVVWKDTFISPTGRTYYPCDIRWAPNGQYIIVPMRFNNSVDEINATNGQVIRVLAASPGSQPYMLSPNNQGTMLAVEYVGNNSVGFYSLPNLSLLGIVKMPGKLIPQRGVFTSNGQYYLEAPANENEVVVISTSNFSIIENITLPSTSSPGLSEIQLAPGGNYAYVVIHGNPQSGGMIVLISLSSMGIAYEIPLTTAPAIVLPLQTSAGTYLVDNVLLPPVTGLHC
ncbi:MAG: YncE family protein [Saccharolobus sp.]|jgi:DNA-binding beta-propeller fold protein YncE|uniref:YncE family protein n=1 Tax=Saccharolobus sp. TaxID=2100761 RepID=UPI0028CE4CD7|nr:YncE family protein [Saccharolobus sp.]MDT7862251.1 YncE family protein [Saccharolobus sp.]